MLLYDEVQRHGRPLINSLLGIDIFVAGPTRPHRTRVLLEEPGFHRERVLVEPTPRPRRIHRPSPTTHTATSAAGAANFLWNVRRARHEGVERVDDLPQARAVHRRERMYAVVQRLSRRRLRERFEGRVEVAFAPEGHAARAAVAGVVAAPGHHVDEGRKRVLLLCLWLLCGHLCGDVGVARPTPQVVGQGALDGGLSSVGSHHLLAVCVYCNCSPLSLPVCLALRSASIVGARF